MSLPCGWLSSPGCGWFQPVSLRTSAGRSTRTELMYPPQNISGHFDKNPSRCPWKPTSLPVSTLSSKAQRARQASEGTGALLFYESSHAEFPLFRLPHPPLVAHDGMSNETPQKSRGCRQGEETGLPAAGGARQFQNCSLVPCK